MKRNLLSLVFGLAILLSSGFNCPEAADGDLALRHIRNATAKLDSGDTTFLIDPMFADVGAYEGFPDTHRSWLRNPLVPLPMPVKDILEGVDAVVLTHTNLDHWDKTAAAAIPKDIPFYVQNEDDAKIVRDSDFTNVRVMKPEDEFGGVKMERTPTRHGTDAMYADPETGNLLGDVMCVVFTTPQGKKAWLVADTIWFDGVDKALEKHNPDVIIMN